MFLVTLSGTSSNWYKQDKATYEGSKINALTSKYIVSSPRPPKIGGGGGGIVFEIRTKRRVMKKLRVTFMWITFYVGYFLLENDIL